MSELQNMLRVQARLHRKQGANALGDLFQSAALEIEILTERLENPQGLQELICVEQMKEISLPEIHRANQKLHEQLAKANEDYKALFSAFELCQDGLKNANERVRDLEAQLKRLIDYEADQTLLPEASSQGTRQLVNYIKNDATDVGGCYEVSCGLLDSLFEHYTDKGASKLLNKFAIEKKIEAYKLVLNEYGRSMHPDHKSSLGFLIEQLRKGQ